MRAENSSSSRRPLRRLVGAALAALGLAAACDGAVPQAPECARFVACVQALDQVRGRRTNVTRFEAGGPCWGGDVGARQCTEACARGLPLLTRDLTSIPEACRP